VWLRKGSNPEMDIQFTGQLDVQKDAGEDLKAFGTIEVVPDVSRLVQFGRVFEIEEGTLAFNGPVGDPRLAITAVFEPRTGSVRGTGTNTNAGVRILLGVTGRPEDPTLDLSAEPPMEQSDIFCYIATNSPCGEFAQGGDGDGLSGGQLASQVAIGQATSLVEGLVSEGVGVDIFRIQERGEGAFYLVVGEYVTPNLFVSVEQPITQDEQRGTNSQVPDLTIEYEIQRWLLLRAVRRTTQLGQNAVNLNFLVEYGY
jgi:translocation and assembly module TamB